MRVLKFDHGFKYLQFLFEYDGKVLFTNYVDESLAFFDHLPPCIDIFYGIKVDIFGPPIYIVL